MKPVARLYVEQASNEKWSWSIEFENGKRVTSDPKYYTEYAARIAARCWWLSGLLNAECVADAG